MRWHRRAVDGDVAVAIVRCPGCGEDDVEVLDRSVVTPLAGVVATSSPRPTERRERVLGACHGCGLVSDVAVIDDTSGAASSDLSMTAFLGAALEALRRSAGEWPAITRVRDARVLWERAQCSPLPSTERRWFTAGSLARTLRSAGLRIDALRLDPLGAIVAEVSDAPSDDPPFGVEGTIEDDLAAARRHVERRRTATDELRRRISDEVDGGGSVVVWQAAATSIALLDELGDDVGISAVLDVSPDLVGRHLLGSGLPIVDARCPTVEPSLVVVPTAIDGSGAIEALAGAATTPSFV